MDIQFIFDPKKWHTPNTYDSNFCSVPETSGVYLLVAPLVDYVSKEIFYNILYVGSAKNLAQRYKGHEVLRLLKEVYGYVQFYFRNEVNYRSEEKELIRLIQPKFNKQWL